LAQQLIHVSPPHLQQHSAPNQHLETLHSLLGLVFSLLEELAFSLVDQAWILTAQGASREALENSLQKTVKQVLWRPLWAMLDGVLLSFLAGVCV
jgi:hypothetical protein